MDPVAAAGESDRSLDSRGDAGFDAAAASAAVWLNFLGDAGLAGAEATPGGGGSVRETRTRSLPLADKGAVLWEGPAGLGCGRRGLESAPRASISPLGLTAAGLSRSERSLTSLAVADTRGL